MLNEIIKEKKEKERTSLDYNIHRAMCNTFSDEGAGSTD